MKWKENLNEKLKGKKNSDDRTFWKEIKPYFNGKGGMSSKITLVERDKIIHKDKEIAETMNKYFVNITKTLRLKRSKKYDTNYIDILTSQFKDRASIKKIKLSYPEIVSDTFKFTLVSSEDLKNEIMNPNVKKSYSSKAISATVLKQSVYIYLPFLTNCINHSFVANKFPDELKQSEVIPLYKKLDPLKKENYRAVSLLYGGPSLSCWYLYIKDTFQLKLTVKKVWILKMKLILSVKVKIVWILKWNYFLIDFGSKRKVCMLKMKFVFHFEM